jgi:hypothetical protein
MVPLEDFLPMPSLSTTSSAHWMRRRSAGSALRRNTPDGAERRKTGCGRTSVVVLPPCGVGVAVRVAPGEAMVFEFDMITRERECSVQALESPGCGTMDRRGGAVYAQGPNEESNRRGCQRGTGRAGERHRTQSQMAQQCKGWKRGGCGFAESNSRVYVGIRWSSMISPQRVRWPVRHSTFLGSTLPQRTKAPSCMCHAFTAIACIACDPFQLHAREQTLPVAGPLRSASTIAAAFSQSRVAVHFQGCPCSQPEHQSAHHPTSTCSNDGLNFQSSRASHYISMFTTTSIENDPACCPGRPRSGY